MGKVVKSARFEKKFDNKYVKKEKWLEETNTDDFSYGKDIMNS